MLVISPYETKFQQQVIDLILAIQRDEFGIDITAAQQPDLMSITDFYQSGEGNFWLALDGGNLVGTIALRDIGNGNAALRKMFVAAPYRGKPFSTAQLLLETLVDWSRQKQIDRIYLGTTENFLAAHRFYEKNGFVVIEKYQLPESFPVMSVDKRFYTLKLCGPG